jgi:hypothetical protein
MFTFSHRFYKPFKSDLSSLFSFVFPVLFVTLSTLLSTNIAHCFNPSFAWNANSEPDLAGYKVFYRERDQQYDFDNPDWEGTETSCSLYGFNDNTTYYFVARAYNIYGQESENSVELSNITKVTSIASTDGGGGGGCFIATAAYGSKFEKHVQIIRKFRDLYLMPHSIGRAFVRAYYRYSPSMAGFIAGHGTLRMWVRWGLLPLIGFSWLVLYLGALPTMLLLVLMVSAGWLCVKKMKFRR